MNPERTASPDPFREKREKDGVLATSFQDRPVAMILGHKDVRRAAQDWKTYSNDAPFRVPIPSEEDVRTVRQLPIEADPPDHTEYRRLVDSFFSLPKEEAYIARVEKLVVELIDAALARPETEVVREFALPLQSRALTYLLRMPESEADVWIAWGVHVFRDGEDGAARGTALERYIHERLDEAEKQPGDDFFSALTQAEFRGRHLTREEMIGFASVTFAGGRDTLIQSIAGTFGVLAKCPDALAALQARPSLVNTAAEEFFRVMSPLTHIGRVCPHATEVKGVPVAADERVSLCWASANRNATVFDAPDEMRLDRKPNPHIAFGSGPHTCLGALHARLLVRTLLAKLAACVKHIEIVRDEPHVEREADYHRQVGHDALVVRLTPRD